MSFPIQPVNPVIIAEPVSGVVLRPGAEIDATVLKLLENNLVRIAIANMALDVATEIPLQAGQTLRFAVAQGENGTIRLLVLPQAGAAGQASSASAAQGVARPAGVNSNASSLTPAQAQAVAAAVSTAATRQGGLSPLFANLLAASAAEGLPPQLRSAIADVLAARLPGDGALTGAQLKSAFENSGLFFERQMAGGGTSSAHAGAGPDLKGAMLVLRHVLSLAAAPSGAALRPQPLAPTPAGGSAAAALLAESPPLVPPQGPDEMLAPQAGGRGGVEYLAGATPQAVAGRAAATSVMLGLLQDALGPGVKAGLPLAQPVLRDATAGFRNEMPPPPFRGATPSAQPLADPTITDDMPLPVAAQRLLSDTEAALARQTLLQAASLPGAVDAGPVRAETLVARWLFEVPIALPQGTAVAQFEISRDGGSGEEEASEAGRRIWRARFSLNLEPAGPIHALVSLAGQQTSVRLWAERPQTTARLRADLENLSSALREAALEPGEILVGDGAPVPAAAPAGHFWDRAS